MGNGNLEMNVQIQQSSEILSQLQDQGGEFVEQINKTGAVIDSMRGNWEGQSFANVLESWNRMIANIMQVTKDLTEVIPNNLIGVLKGHIYGDSRSALAGIVAAKTMPQLTTLAVVAVGASIVLNTQPIKSALLEADASLGVAGTILNRMSETADALNVVMSSDASGDYIRKIKELQSTAQNELDTFRNTFRTNIEQALQANELRDENNKTITEGIEINAFGEESEAIMKETLNKITAANDWKTFIS